MKKQRRKKIVLLVVGVLLGIFFIFVLNFSHALTEYYSEFWTSKSLEQAKTNGVFVRKVNIHPRSFLWKGKQVNFGNAWIEKKSKINYKYFLFKERIIFEDYKLVFTLESHKDIYFFDFMFVHGDRGSSFAIQGSGDRLVYMEQIENINTDTIKLSVLENWKEERKNTT